jgi:hypothetical protein
MEQLFNVRWRWIGFLLLNGVISLELQEMIGVDARRKHPIQHETRTPATTFGP